jgi:4-amino-4-deoxy-L-arabinose transferase-like glycosyltransferase
MSMRTRTYVGLAVLVALLVVLDRLGNDWSDVQFYAAAAGLLVVFGPLAMLWTEMAPDGALRRRPRA